jgi:hypothetical protein
VVKHSRIDGSQGRLVTHQFIEGEPVDCRPHPRGSVRRASGFVLTGQPQGILFKLAYGGIPRDTSLV